MVQDGAFDSPQTGARLDAEFFHKRPPRSPVGSEGLRLAPATVQRDHQLLVEPLAEWVSLDEPLQLTDQVCVMAEGQISIDPIFDGTRTQLFQARDLRLDEQLVVQVR